MTKVQTDNGGVALSLSDGTPLMADHVVFATGYKADVARVPYPGFAATRDFGPFYGFTKGCPSAARIAVTEMVR